jgi:hypothetical protein
MALRHGLCQVLGNVLGGFLATFNPRGCFLVGAGLCVAHATVVHLALRETGPARTVRM